MSVLKVRDSSERWREMKISEILSFTLMSIDFVDYITRPALNGLIHPTDVFTNEADAGDGNADEEKEDGE